MNPVIEILNQAGQTWWDYVFYATWTSSLVAALLLAVVWVGRRWPAQLRYAIILIALIKFAVPPMLAMPVGLFSQFGPTIPERTEPLALSDRPMDSEADSSIWPALFPAWERLNWQARLMLLYASGCILAGAWIISRLAKLAGMAHRAKRVTTGKWHKLFSRLSKSLAPGRPVSLLLSSEAVPPMAFGLLRPCVMVPLCVLRDLPSQRTQVILSHELAHHRRADLWINSLQSLLGILWWFNPFVHLLNRVLRQIREDCCDDLLLCRNLTTDETYCQALLQVTANLSRSARLIAALGFARTIHPLGRRIKRIMDPQVHRWSRISLGAVASMAVLAVLLLPGLSSEHSASSEAPLGGLVSIEPQPDTQGQTVDLAAGSPQQVADIQPRIGLPARASQTAVSSSESDDSSRSNPVASVAFDKYSTSPNADARSGSVMGTTPIAQELLLHSYLPSRSLPRDKSDVLASEVFADDLPAWSPIPFRRLRLDGRSTPEKFNGFSPIFAGTSQEWKSESGHLFAQSVPEQYNLSFFTLARDWPANELYADALELADSLAWSEVLLVEALDPDILFQATELSDLSETLLFLPGDPITTSSQTDLPDNRDDVLVLASSVRATDPIDDAIEFAGLTDVEMPTAVAFAGSLGPAEPSRDIVLVDGFDGFGTIPDAIVMDSSESTIPEPMTIWVLASGGLLLLGRRRSAA